MIKISVEGNKNLLIKRLIIWALGSSQYRKGMYTDDLIKRNPLPRQFHTEPVKNCRIYLELEGLSSPISNNPHPHQWCRSMPKMLDPLVNHQPIPSRPQKRTDTQYGTDSKKEFLRNCNLKEKFQCVMHKMQLHLEVGQITSDQYFSSTFCDTSFQHRLLCLRRVFFIFQNLFQY